MIGKFGDNGLVLLWLTSVVLCGGCRDTGTPRDVATGEDRVIVLPSGDVANGKIAFVDLQCYSCHSIARPMDPTDPARTLPARVALGSLTEASPSRAALANRILKPSHGLVTTERRLDAPLPMVDYSYRMTIRQLADLVAYLQSTYVGGAGPQE